MQTRAKSGISKKKIFVPATHLSNSVDVEPTSYTQASKFPAWQRAMEEEYATLLK